MKIICGLGNPGQEYAGTRHNVGFDALNLLARRHRLEFSGKKFSARFAKGAIGRESVVMLKPGTYMNRSGQSVGPAVGFYKLSPEDLIVVHDELDLPLGRVVVKEGGGTAGHKGLNSIVSSLGTQGFLRVRFGIGRPEHPDHEMADFVLSRWALSEKKVVEECLERAADAVETILDEGVVVAMNRFNAIK